MSVCLCMLPRELFMESVPAAQGGMDGTGGLPQYGIFSNKVCMDKQRGRFCAQMPWQIRRPLGADPEQKAVKKKVSVQTKGIAALVCCLLALLTLFKGLPLIIGIKET